MNRFQADLHNHTVLSPCGDIEMTPTFIISSALEKGYDIIGITDHNTLVQAREIHRIVGEGEPYILCGAEITTKEEVHCLAFAEGETALDALQNYLDANLPRIPNNEDVFGYQLAVNDVEEVIYEAPYLLISAISQTLEEVAAFVHSIGGLVIPAHIDKRQNSVISQLGFLPPDLPADAIEFSSGCDIGEYLSENPYLRKFRNSHIRSSDAHYPEDFGKAVTYFDMECRCFEEIRKALSRTEGRHAEPAEYRTR